METLAACRANFSTLKLCLGAMESEYMPTIQVVLRPDNENTEIYVSCVGTQYLLRERVVEFLFGSSDRRALIHGFT